MLQSHITTNQAEIQARPHLPPVLILPIYTKNKAPVSLVLIARVERIELPLKVLETFVLPLYDTRKYYFLSILFKRPT